MLARFGVPVNVIPVILQSQDGMRTGVRLGNSETSEWFDVD